MVLLTNTHWRTHDDDDGWSVDKETLFSLGSSSTADNNG
jgi:hypothetical protein